MTIGFLVNSLRAQLEKADIAIYGTPHRSDELALRECVLARKLLSKTVHDIQDMIPDLNTMNHYDMKIKKEFEDGLHFEAKKVLRVLDALIKQHMKKVQFEQNKGN